MTDQQSHPTTFGSIHDYLKRVNGETADLGIPWRNKGQQNKASEATSAKVNEEKTSSSPSALKLLSKPLLLLMRIRLRMNIR